MKRIWHSAALVSAVVLMAATANAQTAAWRPFSMSGQSQQVIDPLAGSACVQAVANATHLGLVTSEGCWLLTDPVVMMGMKAPNGDVVYWENVQGSFQYVITGGTGRFEGASGSYVVTLQFMSPPTPNPDGTLTIDLKWTAAGTIRY